MTKEGRRPLLLPLGEVKGRGWFLRLAQAADLSRIQAMDEARGPGAWTRDAYRGYLQGLSGTLALVVCPLDNLDLPYGFALARFLVDELEILQIIVDKEKRGQGLGTLLMAALAQKGLEAKKEAWILEVRENNQPALGLYRSFGFEAIGRRPGYYPDSGESAILMRADLGFLGTNDNKLPPQAF